MKFHFLTNFIYQFDDSFSPIIEQREIEFIISLYFFNMILKELCLEEKIKLVKEKVQRLEYIKEKIELIEVLQKK